MFESSSIIEIIQTKILRVDRISI